MSVKRVTVHVAKTQLSRLIQAAENGDDVVIARRDVPVVRLVPIRKRLKRRKFGAMKGRARVDASFFEALPQEDASRTRASRALGSRSSTHRSPVLYPALTATRSIAC